MQRLPIYNHPLDGVVYSDSQYPEVDTLARTRNRRRIRIFLTVVAISLLIGLSYTFLRPAIYESSATMLVTPPVIDDQAGDVTNAQHVELELKFLTRHSLLSGLLERLSRAGQLDDATNLTLPELQEMLAATSVENTNLIELTARGPDKHLLPVVINTWIDTYLDAHDDAMKAESDSDATEINQQLDELKKKVDEKRLTLDRFRKDYDIVTMERNENRILRKLSGLSDSLNKANEEKVAAQARLGAIRTAISQGKPVTNSHGQESIDNLEQQLAQIQEQLKDLENEFTPRYMSVDPKIKGLVRKRELLEQEIRNKRREGTQSALAQAEQDFASARGAVTSLQRQLDEHKQRVMEFTTRFAEHEALQEELLQLETAYREVQDRQLQIQVNARRQYPQIRIKERAFLPERPAYPDYVRDAGISTAVSLVAGLLVIWLYDFLTRPLGHTRSHAIKQIFVTSPETRIMDPATETPLLHPASAPVMLEHKFPRELSQAEVMELLQNAGVDIRLQIVCLLSGLSAEEIRALRWDDIDRDASVVRVRSENSRTIPLTPPLLAAIDAFMPDTPPGENPIWQGVSGESLAAEDMAAMLLYTANDAGLMRPQEVTPEVVQHTYLAFLARKGVRLNDLPRLVGYIPPATLAAYSVFSPPGASVPLDSVESVYPVLQSYYRYRSTDSGVSFSGDSS